MSNDTEPNQSIRATINGNVNGQVAVGQNIIQSYTDVHQGLTGAEKRASALERVEELEQAITEKKPNLWTMEYVKKWFGKHIPGLAGALGSRSRGHTR